MEKFHFGADGGEFYNSNFFGNSIPKVGYTDSDSSNTNINKNSNEKMLGFTYGYMANCGEYNSPQGIKSQEKLYSTGINWVCLAVANYQETYHSTLIYSDHLRTPTDRDIENFIRNAHLKGIKVCLKPMVNTEDGVWRAHIGFPDLHIGDMDYYWRQWFISYKNFLLHYARLAQELNCEMLCIGCEMIGTEHRIYDWLYLIEQIRNVYSGKLIYNANHDREDAQDWFSELDYIGTSAYYPVGINGTLEKVMEEEWEKVKSRLNSIAEKRKKQYVLMEIGCRSVKGAAAQPWDFSKELNEFDENEQASFYESCLKTFISEPNFAGIFWWDWSTKLYDLNESNKDIGYNIYGKKAEEVIKKYYKW